MFCRWFTAKVETFMTFIDWLFFCPSGVIKETLPLSLDMWTAFEVTGTVILVVSVAGCQFFTVSEKKRKELVIICKQRKIAKAWKPLHFIFKTLHFSSQDFLWFINVFFDLQISFLWWVVFKCCFVFGSRMIHQLIMTMRKRASEWVCYFTHSLLDLVYCG